jgi:hypothetical protein
MGPGGGPARRHSVLRSIPALIDVTYTPSMTLHGKHPLNLSPVIWQRWEEKYQQMTADKKWAGKIAGLFYGHEEPGFRAAAKRILYTGKATRGEFNLENLDHDYFGCNKGGFWSFARRLADLTGGDRKKLENIAWSNLCKIGSVAGNPNTELVDEQADLAVETLKLEWAELKPTLVVCVAEGYEESLVYQAFNVTQNQNDGFSTRNESGFVFWTRPAQDGMPAFLWMKHPQGKTQEYLDAALSIAAEMLAT